MPDLNVQAAMTITSEEETALCGLIECDPGELNARLAPYAAAALREYVEMFSGQATSTASDTRERRLLAILLAPGANFPTDERIARMFNVTITAARSLLRTTLSRHRLRLAGVFDAAAAAFRAGCVQTEPGGRWEGRCPNAVVVESLNERLATVAQPRAPIRRAPATFDTYSVGNGSYEQLLEWHPE